MKKISFVIALALVITALAAPAMATDCSIAEHGFSVTVPDGWFVLTPDTPADDAGLEYFGITPEQFAEEMVPQGLYLHALSPEIASQNVRDEFKISVVEDETTQRIFTYADFTEETLSALALEYLNALEEENLSGFIRMSRGSYTNNGINYGFASYWIARGEDYVNTRQYFTTYNGKMITFTWDSFNEKAMEDDQAVIDSVLSSLKFDKTLRNPNAPMTKTELMRIIFFGLAGAALLAAIVCIIVDSVNKKKKLAAESECGDECECECEECADECECDECKEDAPPSETDE